MQAAQEASRSAFYVYVQNKISGPLDSYVVLDIARTADSARTRGRQNSEKAARKSAAEDTSVRNGCSPAVERFQVKILREIPLHQLNPAPSSGDQRTSGASRRGEEAPATQVGQEPLVKTEAQAGAGVEGRITVRVEDATGLPQMDRFTRKADPYVVLTLRPAAAAGAAGAKKGGADAGEIQTQTARTSCKKGTLEPVWGEEFGLSCAADATQLVVEMFDYEAVGHDRFVCPCVCARGRGGRGGTTGVCPGDSTCWVLVIVCVSVCRGPHIYACICMHLCTHAYASEQMLRVGASVVGARAMRHQDDVVCIFCFNIPGRLCLNIEGVPICV